MGRTWVQVAFQLSVEAKSHREYLWKENFVLSAKLFAPLLVGLVRGDNVTRDTEIDQR